LFSQLPKSLLNITTAARLACSPLLLLAAATNSQTTHKKREKYLKVVYNPSRILQVNEARVREEKES